MLAVLKYAIASKNIKMQKPAQNYFKMIVPFTGNKRNFIEFTSFNASNITAIQPYKFHN